MNPPAQESALLELKRGKELDLFLNLDSPSGDLTDRGFIAYWWNCFQSYLPPPTAAQHRTLGMDGITFFFGLHFTQGPSGGMVYLLFS